MVDVTSQMSVQAAAAAKPSARRYYVLGLLTIIYALNFLDRTIFNVLIEPIKKEFQLSDTMGLPCPNIFAGEHAFHSRLEWVSRQDMEKAVQTIVHLAMIWEERA